MLIRSPASLAFCSNSTPRRLKPSIQRFLLALALAAVASVASYWIADLCNQSLRADRQPTQIVQAYTEALAGGQSYLKEAPDPALLALSNPYDPTSNQGRRILDASLFRGHYYIYFGVVPFLSLLVPWYLVTGWHLTMAFAVWFFCAGGLLFYCLAASSLIRRNYPNLSVGGIVLSILTVLVASGSWFLLARPTLYDLEPAAGFAFLGLAAWLLASAFGSPKASVPWSSFAASAAAGLALGCRPNLFPAVGVLSVLVLLGKSDLRLPISRRLVALAPLALILVSMFVWNYHRFGSVTEFGYRYQLMTMDRPSVGFASPRYVPYNVLRYVIGLPRIGSYFPFIQGEAPGPLALPINHEPTDQVYGWCVISPILLFAFIGLFRGGSPSSPMIGRALLAAGVGNLALLTFFGNGAARYFVDFQAPLSLAAGLNVARLASAESTVLRRVSKLGSALLLAWSSVATLCVIVSMYDFFPLVRPGDTAKLGRPFNSVVYLEQRLAGGGPRGLGLRLRFPENRFGGVEPLVVIGGRSEQDFLYAYYSGPGRIRLGFESTGHGGPVSAPVELDYSKEHLLELRYGSFLPPDDCPLLGGMTPAERTIARRMLTVLLDGKPVLDGWAQFHMPRGLVFVGESPYDAAFGPKFTGTISRVEHPLLVASASPDRRDTRAYGPLSAEIRMSAAAPGTREPLAAFGNHNQGGTLVLERLAGSEARVGWLLELGSAIWSSPFKLPIDRKVGLIIESGSLLPPLESSLWPASKPIEQVQALKHLLRCRIDGITIWTVHVELPDVSPTTVTLGKNTLMVGGIAQRMGAEFSGEHRMPWQ